MLRKVYIVIPLKLQVSTSASIIFLINLGSQIPNTKASDAKSFTLYISFDIFKLASANIPG